MGNTTNENADELLTVDEVSEIIKIKPETIRNWVGGANKLFPKGLKLGGRNSPRRWYRSEIDKYLKDRRQAA